LSPPLARRRAKVGCIILGRGEDDQKVREWLATASGVLGSSAFGSGPYEFLGFARNWRAKKITREDAVKNIARRYLEFVETFEEQTRAA